MTAHTETALRNRARETMRYSFYLSGGESLTLRSGRTVEGPAIVNVVARNRIEVLPLKRERGLSNE